MHRIEYYLIRIGYLINENNDIFTGRTIEFREISFKFLSDFSSDFFFFRF